MWTRTPISVTPHPAERLAHDLQGRGGGRQRSLGRTNACPRQEGSATRIGSPVISRELTSWSRCSQSLLAAVRAFVATHGWSLVAEHSDIASGKDDRRPGFQASLKRCRQLGAVLVAARLDRITRRAHTLSQLLEDGYSIRAADMPGADDLMMRIYAAMAQKERELISERTKAALAAARARGKALGGDRGYPPAPRPDLTPVLRPGAAAKGRTDGLPVGSGSAGAAAGRGHLDARAGPGTDRTRRADASGQQHLDPHNGRAAAASHWSFCGCYGRLRLSLPTSV